MSVSAFRDSSSLLEKTSPNELLVQQLNEAREKQLTVTQVFEEGMSYIAKSLGQVNYKTFRKERWYLSLKEALSSQMNASNTISVEDAESPEGQLSEIIQKIKAGQAIQRHGERLIIKYLECRWQIALRMKLLWEEIHPLSKEVLAREADFFEGLQSLKRNKIDLWGPISTFEAKDSILGTVLWEMAKIFGVDNFFIPTRQSLSEFKQTVYLQPAIKVTEHLGIVEGKESPSHADLCNAIILSLLFGMYTTNTNVCFSKEFVFFMPHNMIMPHSNGMVLVKSSVYPAFHSFLFSLKGCYELLSPEEKEQMSQFLSRFNDESCLEQLQDLLNSYEPAFDNKERFNPEEMMEAFKERLTRLKEVLTPENDQIRNLRDTYFLFHDSRPLDR